MIYTPLPLQIQLTTSTHLLLLQHFLDLKQDPCSLMATCLYFHLQNKRDWAIVEEESVVLLPNLLWPPKNWRRLTPDQCLLAVEFASMSLTQGERHYSLLFPERSFLIHSFHFLVLPGSAGFPLNNKARARIYTYQSLLDIANGKNQSPFTHQEDLLKALTPLSKNSSTLLDKINHIPVRI
ncbi:hypothetical protein DPMN_053824 [Dreissena polymorpha]|uniref:Uncharacterized protein n=1 Tax=Dreissena polymorpha TaxID=45954 RepID=A0A9D4CM35_DREPO|nr:hypothetical protein DPMN_053824 [Dreissena polymorpha]